MDFSFKTATVELLLASVNGNPLQELSGYPFPHDSEYDHCKGSDPKYRGYSCGLWMAFHALSVNYFMMHGFGIVYRAITFLKRQTERLRLYMTDRFLMALGDICRFQRKAATPWKFRVPFPTGSQHLSDAESAPMISSMSPPKFSQCRDV